MALKIQPLSDRVVVEPQAAETKTASGLYIPDSAKEKPQQGEIISIGTGHMNDNGQVTPLAVKEGDRVLFTKWSGTEVTIDGEELLVMKESDIMGILAA